MTWLARILLVASLVLAAHAAPAESSAAGDPSGGSGEGILDELEELVEDAGEPPDDAAVTAGANASDPTASVNFVDLRYRWLDLGRDRKRSWYTLEGAYVWGPVKITHELNYWDTDLTGRDEADFESFKLKGIYLASLGGE